MKAQVITDIVSARGIIPAGSIIEIPESVFAKLRGRVIPLPEIDWRPEPKAWLTDTGELRTTGAFPGQWPDGGLTPEIIRLTTDNLPLQRKLLRECVDKYSNPQWKYLVEDWNERAGILQYDGGLTRQDAELAAAKLYRIEAFFEELILTTGATRCPE